MRSLSLIVSSRSIAPALQLPDSITAVEQVAEQWVARAHGAVSGCDAHTAYGPDLDENSFFGFLFDSGDIFSPSYDAVTDEDPQVRNTQDPSHTHTHSLSLARAIDPSTYL